MTGMAFSEKLRMLIEEQELTQKELAIALKIPASTLGGYVQGTSEPDFDTLKLFVHYFNVSSDYLLDIPTSDVQSSIESELLRIFRSLSSEQQEIYLEQGKVFSRINTKKTHKCPIVTSNVIERAK